MTPKQQARRRVRTAVQRGDLPHASTLPCVDCGHIWRPGEFQHHYDHYLDYSPKHALHVQAVCTRCHYDRGVARGERRPSWRARRGPLSDALTVVQRTCERCSAPIEVSVRRLRWGHGRFCSIACRNAVAALAAGSLSKLRAAKPSVTRTCQQCGADFVVQQYLVAKGYGRFCSLKCKGLASRKAQPTADETVRRTQPASLHRGAGARPLSTLVPVAEASAEAEGAA